MVGYRYGYAADLDFESLKKMLKEFLGEGWNEKEGDPRMSKALKQVMKVQGVDLAGHATFSNPAFPGHVFISHDPLQDHQPSRSASLAPSASTAA